VQRRASATYQQNQEDPDETNVSDSLPGVFAHMPEVYSSEREVHWRNVIAIDLRDRAA
jgi:hypothetical protein